MIKSGNIDVQGGEISLPELDITVIFPAYALLAKKLITLQLVDTAELHPPLHEGQFLLGPVISCKPDGLMFSKPVTISMPHSCQYLYKEWVQVLCKNENTDGSEWEKIYDGMQEHQPTGVHVEIEDQRIKFRVNHFTIWGVLTAPIKKVPQWLLPYSPELQLDIWVFMNPVHVVTTKLVQLRVYALKTNDKMTKHLVKEEENEIQSGRCAVPTMFVLQSSGEDLRVRLRDIYPAEKWTANSSMEKTITFTNIQLGGLGARCDFMFHLSNIDQPEHLFGGEFNLAQEGNPQKVDGINFTDQLAVKKADAGTQQAFGMVGNAQDEQANPVNAGMQEALHMSVNAQVLEANPANAVVKGEVWEINPAHAGSQQEPGMVENAQGVQANPAKAGTQQALGMAANAQDVQVNPGNAGVHHSLSMAGSTQGAQAIPAKAGAQQAPGMVMNANVEEANTTNTGMQQALSMVVKAQGAQANLANAATQQAHGMVMNVQGAQANPPEAGTKQPIGIVVKAQGPQRNPANADVQLTFGMDVKAQVGEANTANAGMQQVLGMEVKTEGAQANPTKAGTEQPPGMVVTSQVGEANSANAFTQQALGMVVNTQVGEANSANAEMQQVPCMVVKVQGTQGAQAIQTEANTQQALGIANGKGQKSERKTPILPPVPDSLQSEINIVSVEKLSDTGPFLKVVARRIQPKWIDLALTLGFTEQDCKQFEKKLNLPWWPVYKMLDYWIHKLSRNELQRWKQMLKDAIQPLDKELATELF